MSDLLTRAKELAKQGEFDRSVEAQKNAEKLYHPNKVADNLLKGAYDGITITKLDCGDADEATLKYLEEKFKNNHEFDGIFISSHKRSLFLPSELVFKWVND